MSDSLLPYYRAEIEALRSDAAEFSRAFPKLAERLRIAGTTSDDPHVERLLEGAAFLGARVQHRLDDEFPELTDALLGVLYPHYLAPFPSCLIARYASAPDAPGVVSVPRDSAIETPPVNGEICTFRTAAPLSVWPVEIEQARFSGVPLPAPENRYARDAQAVLHLSLRCASPDRKFSDLKMDRLRLFLGPSSPASLQLHEMLCGHAMSVAYADGMGDPRPVVPVGERIAPAGFAPDENLLPWPARSFSGFRLLTEFFGFPEKFLFVDLLNVPSERFGNKMDVFVYLDQDAPELARSVNKDSVQLNCVPAVNLFPMRCEPIPVDHTAIEMRVSPDRRRAEALEVWSIEQIRETWEGGSRDWRAFYRLTRALPDSAIKSPSYVPVRRSLGATRQGERPVGGTEVFVAPCDVDFDADSERQSVLTIDALCTNRDLPRYLPFGGDGIALRSIADTQGIVSVRGVVPASHGSRPRLGERRFWRLVSHFALGHLSLAGVEGAATLRETLRLYNLGDSDAAEAGIAALVDVECRPGTARVPGMRPGAFCRGLDVDLVFEPRAWQTHGLYLMASVLDRFLALHGQINSFVRTRARWRDRRAPVAAWPPRAGARVLL